MSTVLIIPAAHQAEMNAIGEHIGYGPSNVTVPLFDAAETLTHYGCHSWRYPQELDSPPPPTAEQQAALDALYVRHVPDGEPLVNWAAALSELGLHEKAEVAS